MGSRVERKLELCVILKDSSWECECNLFFIVLVSFKTLKGLENKCCSFSITCVCHFQRNVSMKNYRKNNRGKILLIQLTLA